MKNVLTFTITEDDLRCPIADLVSLVESRFDEPSIVGKLCHMLFRVYVDVSMFEYDLEVFNYMVSNGLKIDERSCIISLLALKRCGKMEACLNLFEKILESDIEITVYSLTIVIGALCKSGKVQRAKDLLIEMSVKGIKPTIFTYNTLLNAYIKMDFGGVNEMLKLMAMEETVYNASTYTILIAWFGSNRKFVQAEKLFEEMHERKVEPDVHVYTSVICWNCKAGNLRMTFMLFDEMAKKGIATNVHTYGALIDSVCKAGKVEAAEILLNEMQSKGFDVNVVFNIFIDGYCRKGFINKAIKVLAAMEKKGFNEDIFTHNIIASGLSKLQSVGTAIRKFVEPEGPVEFSLYTSNYCYTRNIII
ncbi:hypothetical protein K2173_006978 [Erythroxylum novogranatense]|uniref:Pentatricopeptide repeat-containing protein n=1 Tax=Erythroxylum novogranatense TaxID=1862640 RepID=A0AAV8SZG7_9ROSI|nr:hypothetical protein K2173_006978 [Erythroxylum novogranatense]